MSRPIQNQELFKVDRELCTPEANTRFYRPQATQLGPVIDRPVLLARVEGDMELAKELAQLFLEDYPHRLAELREAMSAHDATALARGAHTLKGVLSTLAAHAACTAAFHLEQLARTGDLSQVSTAYASVENELERLIPVLTALTKEITS